MPLQQPRAGNAAASKNNSEYAFPQRRPAMIAIDRSGKLVTVTVLGEFVLADYKEFEGLVRSTLAPGGKVNLLIDLRQMAGFTVDVAWEDIKYTRSHPNDFDKIAAVSYTHLRAHETRHDL